MNLSHRIFYRADSPGHSAKYGSYTVMEQRINKVIDIQLVQVPNIPIISKLTCLLIHSFIKLLYRLVWVFFFPSSILFIYFSSDIYNPCLIYPFYDAALFNRFWMLYCLMTRFIKLTVQRSGRKFPHGVGRFETKHGVFNRKRSNNRCLDHRSPCFDSEVVKGIDARGQALLWRLACCKR